MTSLAGKHALITGGGSGLGAAIASALAACGAGVTLLGRRPEPLQEAANGIAGADWRIADVTDLAEMEQAARSTADRYGRLDIVIANAGVAASIPFRKMAPGDLRAILETNLVGVFNTWRAALDHMADPEYGRLIAIASTAGLHGAPYITGYCASKHGVVGLTRSLALEMASTGTTVNAVCPGYTESPMLDRTIENISRRTGRGREEAVAWLQSTNPQGRFIKTAEVAAATLWLCDPLAQAVNGQAIAISGG
jgi:3-hydroxybutyrate dehydrogenase